MSKNKLHGKAPPVVCILSFRLRYDDCSYFIKLKYAVCQ
jgi:hypothetical protein